MLTELYNRLFREGKWPKQWASAAIVPLYKNNGGSKHNPTNYRGISIMSAVAKGMEIILNNRLQQSASDHGKISDLQGGFRRNRGTIDQLFILNEIVHTRHKAGDTTYLAFIDVAKAYDRVWRPGLYLKLARKGVRGWMHTMIRAMLANVQRCVRINNNLTQSFVVGAGVPQGSVLSPFLYSIYIDGLHEEMEKHGYGVWV